MKIIVLPDLHGSITLLPRITDVIASADVVLLPGDLTNSGKVSDAEQVIMAVRHHNPNVLAICGNWDSDAIDSYLTREGINLHCQSKRIEDTLFWGCGGALPYIGRIEYSEETFHKLLGDTAQMLKNDLPHVLVCHQPPYGTLNDRTNRGEYTGSRAVRDYIEATQPLICFTGHIHEGVGIDTIGKTQIVNPGPIWDGGYAYAEILDGKIQCLELHEVQRRKK